MPLILNCRYVNDISQLISDASPHWTNEDEYESFSSVVSLHCTEDFEIGVNVAFNEVSKGFKSFVQENNKVICCYDICPC